MKKFGTKTASDIVSYTKLKGLVDSGELIISTYPNVDITMPESANVALVAKGGEEALRVLDELGIQQESVSDMAKKHVSIGGSEGDRMYEAYKKSLDFSPSAHLIDIDGVKELLGKKYYNNLATILNNKAAAQADASNEPAKLPLIGRSRS